MNVSFKNKRILVTGGCQGIGKDTCLRLSQHGGIVIALSNHPDNLKKLSDEHPEIQTICVDLLDWNSTRAAVEKVLPIDLLVNNAGIGTFTPCLTATPEDFDRTFGVNVKAMLNVSQVVGQNMVERNVPGSIVNLSSITSRAAISDSVIYSASKAAVNMITKVMALELGPHNIRVNCVQPTVVLTELGKVFSTDVKRSGTLLRRMSLNRFAETNEVVDAVVFLLGDCSSMITGTELPVDGGYLST